MSKLLKSTKKRILVANWKTYIQNLATVKNTIDGINKFLDTVAGLIICPPSIYIQTLVEEIKNPNIAIGSQDISVTESNANTGEILASMQKDMGCSYSIIGHSEIRECYKESDNIIATKSKIALKYGITPIICIGETTEIRNNGNYLQFLINQLIESLPPIESISDSTIIVAYEPIWAIGTGRIPSTDQIAEVITNLKLIPGLGKCQFLYGGSVNENNIKEISSIKILDGVLVGSASTDINKLSAIYQVLG